MRAIAVGDEIGIGAAATAGTRDRIATSADDNFKKGVDMFGQDGERWWYHRAVVSVVVVWSNQRNFNIHSQPRRNGADTDERGSGS